LYTVCKGVLWVRVEVCRSRRDDPALGCGHHEAQDESKL
jgi:hypothetical protein